jgi:hypothetical protein
VRLVEDGLKVGAFAGDEDSDARQTGSSAVAAAGIRTG